MCVKLLIFFIADSEYILPDVPENSFFVLWTVDFCAIMYYVWCILILAVVMVVVVSYRAPQGGDTRASNRARRSVWCWRTLISLHHPTICLKIDRGVVRSV